MAARKLPRGWWGYFDCTTCGHQEPAQTLADAYRLAREHRCPPLATVTPLRPEPK